MSKKKKEEMKTDGWLGTYADTMTLLLTFFVLLYSLSTVNQEAFQQISNSFQVMFKGKASNSILDFNMANGDVPVVGKPNATSSQQSKNKQNVKDKVYEKVSNYISTNNLSKDVTVFQNEKGINMQLKESVLFETGQAQLVPSSRDVLDKINSIISNMNNKIIIEGHTDNVPISNPQFPNNWYLSSARALSVLDYFIIDKHAKNPERFIAEACGEYEPIVPNDSDENRAKNRRVNIIIVTDEKE